MGACLSRFWAALIRGRLSDYFVAFGVLSVQALVYSDIYTDVEVALLYKARGETTRYNLALTFIILPIIWKTSFFAIVPCVLPRKFLRRCGGMSHLVTLACLSLVHLDGFYHGCVLVWNSWGSDAPATVFTEQERLLELIFWGRYIESVSESFPQSVLQVHVVQHDLQRGLNVDILQLVSLFASAASLAMSVSASMFNEVHSQSPLEWSIIILYVTSCVLMRICGLGLLLSGTFFPWSHAYLLLTFAVCFPPLFLTAHAASTMVRDRDLGGGKARTTCPFAAGFVLVPWLLPLGVIEGRDRQEEFNLVHVPDGHCSKWHKVLLPYACWYYPLIKIVHLYHHFEQLVIAIFGIVFVEDPLLANMILITWPICTLACLRVLHTAGHRKQNCCGCRMPISEPYVGDYVMETGCARGNHFQGVLSGGQVGVLIKRQKEFGSVASVRSLHDAHDIQQYRIKDLRFVPAECLVEPVIPDKMSSACLGSVPVADESAQWQWKFAVAGLAERGFELEQLLDFYVSLGEAMPHFDYEKSTTADVVFGAVIPGSILSAKEGCAYATIMQKGMPTVPKRFVSHTWKSCFSHLVGGILADALGDTCYQWFPEKVEFSKNRIIDLKRQLGKMGVLDLTYWVCSFSINQHCSICHLINHNDSVTGKPCPVCTCRTAKFPNGNPACEMDKFEEMMVLLSQVSGFKHVIVVDEEFTFFSRAWCVAELVQGRRLNTQQQVKVHDKQGVLHQASSLMKIDIGKCEASRPEDVETILSHIPNIEEYNCEIRRTLLQDQCGILPNFIQELSGAGFGTAEVTNVIANVAKLFEF